MTPSVVAVRSTCSMKGTPETSSLSFVGFRPESQSEAGTNSEKQLEAQIAER